MIKQQQFILTVVIPIEDNYDTVIRLLRFSSYEKVYEPSFTEIHKIIYRFGPLSEEGVENFKGAFKDIFMTSPFKRYCEFVVSEIDG